MLNKRTLFRTMHGMHPDAGSIRGMARIEDKIHVQECETPFSEESYDFTDWVGNKWRQWICWCGTGTYVERLKND